MTELFLVVGAIAVLSAMFMLFSRNAVHSALFLVVTMVAIAFMFLMLNAPFLAMIQITVYAGAIMVLFIFVIMLLGAEREEFSALIGQDRKKFRWYYPAVTIAVAVFLIAVIPALLNSHITEREIPAAQPQVRVMNAASAVGTVDVYAGDTLIASDVIFGTTSDFVSLPAGESTVRLVSDDGSEVNTTVTLEAGTASTVVAYGSASPSFAVVPIDLSNISDGRSGRYVVFNGYAGAPVRLTDTGAEHDPNDDNILVNELPTGQYSDAFIVQERSSANWWFVNALTPENVVTRLEDYQLQRDVSQLIVVAESPATTGAAQPTAIVASVESAPAFGGPRAIGYSLFTSFVLPFQLLALLLLAAMVGAIVLTHREVGKVREKVGGRRRVSRPLAQVISAQVGTDVESETPQLPTGDGQASSQAAGD
ncbi:MAG: NADH-quinone oxidoreductase subunit J [Anaerolineae bacterium]